MSRHKYIEIPSEDFSEILNDKGGWKTIDQLFRNKYANGPIYERYFYLTDKNLIVYIEDRSDGYWNPIVKKSSLSIEELKYAPSTLYLVTEGIYSNGSKTADATIFDEIREAREYLRKRYRLTGRDEFIEKVGKDTVRFARIDRLYLHEEKNSEEISIKE